jgi:hypothetical protein
MYTAGEGAAWRRVCYHRDVLGTVKLCGVSVATYDEALLSLADPAVQHMQLPLNLLVAGWRKRPPPKLVSQRPSRSELRSGLRLESCLARFTRAVQERGVTVHARSYFLQGTLVNDAQLWPRWAEVRSRHYHCQH